MIADGTPGAEVAESRRKREEGKRRSKLAHYLKSIDTLLVSAYWLATFDERPDVAAGVIDLVDRMKLLDVGDDLSARARTTLERATRYAATVRDHVAQAKTLAAQASAPPPKLAKVLSISAARAAAEEAEQAAELRRLDAVRIEQIVAAASSACNAGNRTTSAELLRLCATILEPYSKAGAPLELPGDVLELMVALRWLLFPRPIGG